MFGQLLRESIEQLIANRESEVHAASPGYRTGAEVAAVATFCAMVFSSLGVRLLPSACSASRGSTLTTRNKGSFSTFDQLT